MTHHNSYSIIVPQIPVLTRPLDCVSVGDTMKDYDTLFSRLAKGLEEAIDDVIENSPKYLKTTNMYEIWVEDSDQEWKLLKTFTEIEKAKEALTYIIPIEKLRLVKVTSLRRNS